MLFLLRVALSLAGGEENFLSLLTIVCDRPRQQVVRHSSLSLEEKTKWRERERRGGGEGKKGRAQSPRASAPAAATASSAVAPAPAETAEEAAAPPLPLPLLPPPLTYEVKSCMLEKSGMQEGLRVVAASASPARCEFVCEQGGERGRWLRGFYGFGSACDETCIVAGRCPSSHTALPPPPFPFALSLTLATFMTSQLRTKPVQAVGAFCMHFCTPDGLSREPLGHLLGSAVESAVRISEAQSASDLYSFLTRALNLSMQAAPEVVSVLFCVRVRVRVHFGVAKQVVFF